MGNRPSVSLIIVIYRREEAEDQFLFELQRGLPGRGIGPFVSKAARASLSTQLREDERRIWFAVESVKHSGVLSFDDCRLVSGLGDFLSSHPYIYIKNKKFGSARLMGTEQRVALAARLGSVGKDRPLGHLTCGELYIVDELSSPRVKLRWRYEAVVKAVEPILESPDVAGLSALLITVDGVTISRDLAGEFDWIRRLSEYIGQKIFLQRDGIFTLQDLGKLADLPASEWRIFLDQAQVSISFARSTPTGIAWFGGGGNERTLSLGAVADAYLAGRGYVQVEGRLIALPKELHPETTQEALLGLVTFEDRCVPVDRLAKLRKIFSDQVRTWVTERLAEAGFRGTLKPFQLDGVLWMKNLRDLQLGGVLTDEMGLGKTVQTLAFASAFCNEAARILIVAPASVVPNWEHEIRCFLPGSTIITDLDEAGLRGGEGGKVFIVLSYQSALRKAKSVRLVDVDLLVLDEAQFVKNLWTKTAALVRSIKARQRIVLTGTPVENSLSDLWSHLTFLNGFLDHTYRRLLRRFPLFGRSESAADLTRRAFSSIIMRRTKRVVAIDMPPMLENVVYCRMDDSQLKVYRRVLAAFREMLSSSVSGRIPSLALEGLLRLRQCCASPSLLPASLNPDGVGESVKIDLTIDYICNAISRKEKTIVFSQFNGVLDVLAQKLKCRLIGYVRLDGATIDRREPVEKFQGDPSISVFLMAFRAGGVGLNLSAAENVILLDPWWNPAAEQQAYARAHRMGQSHPVYVTKFVCSGTVEEKMIELLSIKKDISDLVLSGGNEFSTSDLLHIIND